MPRRSLPCGAQRRLVERGATATFTDAATRGQLDRVKPHLSGATSEEVNVALFARAVREFDFSRRMPMTGQTTHAPLLIRW